MHYIYKITNIVNNKVYIGQTVKPNRRWKDHQWLSKNKQEQYIHHAMAKYGIENFKFEVIASCITQDQREIDIVEDEIIQQYDSRNSEFGYNIKPGGPSRSGFKHSKETKQKLSEMWYQDHTLEDLKKMQESNIGRKHSSEHGRKISEANKGKQFCLGHKQSQETINKRMTTINEKYGDKKCNAPGCDRTDGHKINGVRYCTMHGQRLQDTGILELRPRPSPPNKGKPMSEETKEKCRLANQGKIPWNVGKHMSKESIEKTRLANLGREPPNKVKLTEDQISIILSDKSRSQIAKELNISPRVVDRVRKDNR